MPVIMWVTRERSGSVIHMITGCTMEDRSRRAVVQRLVRPFVVVKPQPLADADPRLGERPVCLDEDFLVLQASPQPFDEDVVQEPSFAIHADPDAQGLQLTEERRTGELHALVGVENLRLS